MNIHDRYGTKHNIWESVQNWIGGRDLVVTIVANELPISTESAMEEAEATGEKLKKSYLWLKT